MMSLSTQPSTHTLTSAKEELRVYKLQIDSVQREIDRLKSLVGWWSVAGVIIIIIIIIIIM